MDSFQAQDGSQRTALNLLQRKFCGASEINQQLLITRQATSRHSQDRALRTTAVPRATRTLPASLCPASVLPKEWRAGCKDLYDNNIPLFTRGLDKQGVGSSLALMVGVDLV